MFPTVRKQFGFLIVLSILLSGLVPAAQAASAPNIITYQGRVLNANGVPVSDTSLSMSFAFYTAVTDGTCVWSNSSASCASVTARSVTLTTGLFTENLGDTDDSYGAIGDSIFGDNAAIYLEVIIAGETLTPRRRITAAPYALNADTLDGIDSTVLQLFEVGTNGTVENDVATIVGADAAFTYGSGGVGDLRVADELEVMGDGYIDNDLVIGALTSSTETITNVGFSLGGDDLFVAGDAGIEGTLYIDGAIDLVGTATVGDLSCTDCLDFTEFVDAMSLDASTTITLDDAEALVFSNGSTGNVIIDLTSTGDFIIRDAGSNFFRINDDRTVVYSNTTQATGSALNFNTSALTTGTALNMTSDALTTGKGISLSSTSTALSSGRLVDVTHSATYSATTELSGNGLRVNRNLTISDGGAGNILTVSGDLVNISSYGTQTAGTLTDTSDVLAVEQNYATATGDALEVLNVGIGRGIFIDQNGNGNSLVIDSESTSANVVDIDGSTTTTGQIVRIFGGNFTDDTGRALFIDVTESTSTADIMVIQTDSGSSDNNVLRIEADGEVFSDVGFTAGASSTNYYDGSITSTGTMTIDSSGTVQLGEDDDFLPQLGAGSADLGATGTRWDNLFSVAGDFTGVLLSSGGIDLSGALLDLDADNDTSIIASTDDQIDIEIGGVAQTLIMRDPLGADDASSTINSILEINYATPVDTTGTNIHTGLLLDIDVGNATGGTNRISAINVEAMTGDVDVTQLNAIRVEALTGSASNGETALNIASGWDAGIYIEGATPNIWIDDGSLLSFQDSSSNNILALRDISATGNHIFYIDSDTALAFDSNADTDIDITTASNEMLFFQANGTGDTRFGVDGDSIVEVVASAAPQVDMFTITNLGQATTTNDVNALSIVHVADNATTAAVNILPSFTGGATNSLIYQVLNISEFSPTNDVGTDTVTGIMVNALTDPGATINSRGLELGSGWDTQLYFNDTTSFISLVDEAKITFQDAGLNALMVLLDNGTDGELKVNNLTSADNAQLTITGGDATGVGDIGEIIVLTSGTNTAGGSGGDGGEIRLIGGAASGDGTAARAGGSAYVRGGVSTVSTGNAGSVYLIGGDSTGGQNGNIDLQTGGSPTTISVDGGDIAMSADDDIFISSDDDVALSVTAASAIVNLFDNAFSKTIDIGSVDTDSADFIRIGTNPLTEDIIAIGNSHASTVVSVTGGVDWSISVNGNAMFTYIASGQYALCHATNGVATEEITDCTAGPTADYAEQYSVKPGVEYGDIVVPGTKEIITTEGDTMVQLVKSSQAYQGPVVGIVSDNYGDFTSAGYNIDEKDNPMPVALVGRVPVKVTNEGGSIMAGDYLTTSSTAGKAMKATKVGRVIGMALENWDMVSATVMVQVNNSWSMGDVLGTDGTSTLVTDNVIVSSVDTASAVEPSFDSYGLALRGSAWNGAEAEAVEMMLQNVVDDQDHYRLSIRNTSEAEVAYITNEGTMRIAGDMVIGGRLYPSDRGTPQTDKYIYYDGSAGAGGDFMRTNAKGWSTGSYDFAEMFPSATALTSGDIVVFAGSGESVQRATGADGEQLAGIVSTRPGFLAGENIAGAYPIALAGRVPTKVNLSNGVIDVGDPLTASSMPGEAMKMTQAGQVVGYALENFGATETDNLILAYVNVGYWSGAPQTITIVENRASEVPTSGTQNYTALNMSGNIFMATNQILSIGRLEGVSALWSIESDGTIKTEGSMKTVTTSYQGTKVETIAVTSPESVITLTGTAMLVDGRAEVRFEEVVPEFNDVISAIAPIRVIVTPSGPVSLYVSEKDQNHFTVERFVGDSDVEFDWMVTGYRKGYEPEEKVDEVTSDPSIPSEPEPEDVVAPGFSLGEAQEEPVVEEEPATPESPDEPLIDSATQAEGDVPVEPTDVVIEPSSTQP